MDVILELLKLIVLFMNSSLTTQILALVFLLLFYLVLRELTKLLSWLKYHRIFINYLPGQRFWLGISCFSFLIADNGQERGHYPCFVFFLYRSCHLFQVIRAGNIVLYRCIAAQNHQDVLWSDILPVNSINLFTVAVVFGIDDRVGDLECPFVLVRQG